MFAVVFLIVKHSCVVDFVEEVLTKKKKCFYDFRK